MNGVKLGDDATVTVNHYARTSRRVYAVHPCCRLRPLSLFEDGKLCARVEGDGESAEQWCWAKK